MIAKEVMDREIIAVGMETTLKELSALVRQYPMTDFPVVDKASNFQGMIFENDLLEAILLKRKTLGDSDLLDLNSEDLMHRNVMTVSENDDTTKIGAKMLFEKINNVPVITNHKVVGMVTSKSLFLAAMGDLITDTTSVEKQGLYKPESTDEPAETEQQKYERMRFFKRVTMNLPVAYRLTDEKGDAVTDKEAQLGHTVDISAGGLLLKVGENIYPGSMLEIALDLFQNNNPMKRLCRVVRSEPSKEAGFFDIGIMFLAMSIEERKVVDDFLLKGSSEGGN